MSLNRLLLTASAAATPSLRTGGRGAPSLAYAGIRRRLPATMDFSDASPVPEGDGPLTTGTVKFFSLRQQYGFIVPDGVNKLRHEKSELIFVHRANIRTAEGGDGFSPALRQGERVRFRAAPPADGDENAGRAMDVTREDGELVRPFLSGYLKGATRRAQHRFGEEAYEIMGSSADQEEMENLIVAAYDRARDEIERRTASVERAKELYPGYDGS